MRILSAFFAILFIFINPCMIFKVVSELESFFSRHLQERLNIPVIESMCAYVINYNLAAKLRLAVYIGVILLTLVHIMLTFLSLYGTYSSRPAFIRPFLFDAVISSILLFLFFCFSILIYWQITAQDYVDPKQETRVHLRNFYVSASFLLAYLVWIIVSIMAYLDTKKLHADFMYWIVEDQMSMRSKVNMSSDLKSDRSSKGSRTSRVSRASYHCTEAELPKVKSVSVDAMGTKVSIVNANQSILL